MKAAVQELPEQAGIQLANWYWKGVRQFVWERFGTSLSRSSCLNWLHRLGFAFKRPKKRLLKADQAKRKSFVEEYAALWEEAQRTEARIFFADEAHCQGRRQNIPVGRSKNVPPEKSLASVNVRASCSGEVSQRQAGSRLGE